MQLGLREDFNYLLCSSCGCMQLLDIPTDLSAYYPNNNYYSFNAGNKLVRTDLLRKIRTAYLLYGKHRIGGAALSTGYKKPEYLEWVKMPSVQFEDRILDVGAGSGQLLIDLHKNGFSNLSGIDPFLETDLDYGTIKIRKQDIFSLEGVYDYIMLHHVFEHMNHPLQVLQQLYKLLKPGKFLLIRTPVMGMYGWKNYGTDWVGLDAPRHLFIHSIDGMKRLAAEAGFETRKIVFDSGPYHLWASEQYKNDIPLMDARSYMVNRKNAGFTKADMQRFDDIARCTNEEGEGDQAAFYLFKH